MVKRGSLRVLVRPGFFHGATGGRNRVDERELLDQLAGRLGVSLQYIQVKRHDQLLKWLFEGRGDLAVGRFSPAACLQDGAAASPAIDWVSDIFVTSEDSWVNRLEDLDPDLLRMHRSAYRWFVLSVGAGEPGAQLPVPEEDSLETILLRVRSGRYPATVTDSRLADSVGGGLKTIGSLGPVRPLVWAMRPKNPQLRSAVDHFMFAEQVLGRSHGRFACKDLGEIKEDGILRLVTRNSPTTCTIDRGKLQGFEYELVQYFAREIGVRVVLSIPPPNVDPFDWLERGQGDLLALHEPLAPIDENRFLQSVAYRHVDIVAVVSQNNEGITLEDFGGRMVGASRAIGAWVQLMPFEPEISLAPLQNGADSLAALLAVARGDLDVAVVESDIAHIELENRTNLRQGPVVVPEVGLKWVFNVSSSRLHRRADRFLRVVRLSGLVRQLGINMLTRWRPYRPPHLPKVPEGALTPYDEVLKWAGRKEGIDWRLLASLMYEESRFDPNAIGPGGSAGLFQFMPFTWRELGVEDPHHPTEAINAGARYLRKLMDQFPNAALSDRVAMAIASYNVGPRHVFDAQNLAEEMGFDRDQWAGSVETALLILDDSEVARRFPAGVCRCRRAVGYTRRILRRYALYTEQFPPG